jgi:hypothetical protein
MSRFGRKGCGGPGHLGLLLLAWLLTLARSAGASEWQAFGVEDFAGYLAFKSESSSEQLRGAASARRTLEEITRLRVTSYVLHPRFLALTADTAFAVNNR